MKNNSYLSDGNNSDEDMEFTLDFDDLELNFDGEISEDEENSVDNENSDNTNLEDDNKKSDNIEVPSIAEKKVSRTTSSHAESVAFKKPTQSVLRGSNTVSRPTSVSRPSSALNKPVGNENTDNSVVNASSSITERKTTVGEHEITVQDEAPVGTVSKAKVKISPPKGNRPLFDKDKIGKKEDSIDFKKNYVFKNFIKGSNEVTKYLEERQKELRAKYGNENMLDASKIIDLDCVMQAPSNYFSKYADEVKDGINYCRPRIRDSNSYDVIFNAINNPTVKEYQEEAFVLAARYINEFLAKSKFRGIERDIVLNLIINELLGFDVLDPLWNDSRITEIVCNGAQDIQVEIDGEMLRVPSLSFRNREHLENLLERLFSGVGKTLAQSTPQAKGRLHDKSRIFATHHSISPDGPNFNIRRHPHGFWTPQGLIDRGAASVEIMTDLGNLIHKGASFFVAGATSSGKATTHDTLIQTPNGVVTMGEISPGDKVFDHKGGIYTVTDKFPQKPRQVYAVMFSTGNTVHVDAEHNWLVSSAKSRLSKDEKILWQVKTTQEMITEGLFASGDYNFQVPKLEKPVEFNNAKDVKELPVNPYLLGLWLGGYDKVATPNFKKALDSLNLLQTNKHIPTEYLYSSKAARKELVAGIIDSVKENDLTAAQWEFSSTEKVLVDGFIQLVSSLGYKANIVHTEDSAVWTVSVVTKDLLSKNPEKIANYENVTEKQPLAERDLDVISITSIEPVEGRVEEMSCISVDSPDNTYMVSNHFTTTHNTSMLNALTGFYPEHARILTLEDNLEMKPNPKKYLAAAQETRPPSPNVPNDRGVTMRDLVWGSMQMRPEVLIIGEVTDAAAYDLCQALNTGHAGASTFHANSSQLAVTRVSSLVAQSGLTTIEGAYDLIAAAFDFVINVRHFPQDGSRRIFSIDEVGSEPIESNGKLFLPVFPIWKFNEEGIDDEGNVVGMWTKVGEISKERAERRMFDYQKTLTWEELQELSSLPEGLTAV